MGVFIREKNKRLYLDYRLNGRRHTESLHLQLSTDERNNKEVWRFAEIIRQKKMLKIASGEHDLLDPTEARRPLVQYAETLAAKQDPKNPLPKSLRYLREHAGNVQIGAVTEKWVDGYREYLLQQPALGPSTAAKYLDALKMVLRKAVRELILPRNPAEAVRGIVCPETIKVHLTPEEIGKLVYTKVGGKLGGEVKRAFLFDCMTGLRISDVKKLKWGDIVRGDNWQIEIRQQKTKRVVTVPLNDTAIKLIQSDGQEFHHKDELVFPGLSVSRTNTNQYLVAWAKSAGLAKQIGWHTARHTFATLILDGGADFATVSRLLGHTKLATTLIYAITSDRAKRSAVAALPDLAINEMGGPGDGIQS